MFVEAQQREDDLSWAWMKFIHGTPRGERVWESDDDSEDSLEDDAMACSES